MVRKLVTVSTNKDLTEDQLHVKAEELVERRLREQGAVAPVIFGSETVGEPGSEEDDNVWRFDVMVEVPGPLDLEEVEEFENIEEV